MTCRKDDLDRDGLEALPEGSQDIDARELFRDVIRCVAKLTHDEHAFVKGADGRIPRDSLLPVRNAGQRPFAGSIIYMCSLDLITYSNGYLAPG